MKANALLEGGKKPGCARLNRIDTGDIENAGVMDGKRAYQDPVILRAVESSTP